VRPTGRRVFLHCLLIAAAVFVADQITKSLVISHIPLGAAVPGMDAFVKLWHTQNDGVAFSMLHGHRVPLIALQCVLVAAIMAVMLVGYRRYICRARRPLVCMAAFALMLGGGLGNLADRIATGLVTDFVSVGGFAVFNVADACLTAGCGLLILYVLRYTGDR
jgi:signal peptidase II